MQRCTQMLPLRNIYNIFFFFRVLKVHFKKGLLMSIPNPYLATRLQPKLGIEFYSTGNKLSYNKDLNKLHFIIFLSILNSMFTSVLPCMHHMVLLFCWSRCCILYSVFWLYLPEAHF